MYVICKQDLIVSKVKEKYWITTHKLGFQVPKTVDEVYTIDQQMGTTFWVKSIENKMADARVDFEFLNGVTPEQMRY